MPRFSRRLFARFVSCLVLLFGVFGFAQAPFPNLDTLTDFHHPTGTTCKLNGAATATSEKGKLNALKNRYQLPTNNVFSPITLSDLLALPQGRISSQSKVVDFPGSGDVNNQRAVSFVGFVQDVFAAGCRFGESCNCNTKDKALCDAHINLVLDPMGSHTDGRGVIVVEVTERSRRLAKLGLLHSNIGTDWSTQMLRARLLGRWVRFDGWLYFDTDHADQTWILDTDDSVGRNNFRETAWEIHPVMGIEANVPAPILANVVQPIAVALTTPAPGQPTTGTITKEQLLQRIEALARELQSLKEEVRRLPQ